MLSASPHFLINETTLFFHDRRFDTPETKKNLTNCVQAWAQGIPAPPTKKQKVSKTYSVVSVTTVNSSQQAKSSKSVKACTIVVEPTNYLPPPPQRSQPQDTREPPRNLRGTKRQVEELLTSDSDTPSDLAPPFSKQSQTVELSSDAESDSQPQSRKRPTTVSHTSTYHQKDKARLSHALPPPPSHKTASTNELATNSDRSGKQTSQTRTKNPPTKQRHTISRHQRDFVDEPTSDSDAPTAPAPKPKLRKASHTTNRQPVDLASAVEEVDLPSTLYGGLQDEDDAAEQKAAVASPERPRAAAKKSKVSLMLIVLYKTFSLIYFSQASLKVQSQITATARNSSLPPGARELNRWTRYFLPTVVKYVGGGQNDIWTLDERETMSILQEIWNRVYSGENPIGGTKVIHVVGSGVYSVVSSPCFYHIGSSFF
jgi:hypothetical protein